jgi:hypothetical protein
MLTAWLILQSDQKDQDASPPDNWLEDVSDEPQVHDEVFEQLFALHK